MLAKIEEFREGGYVNRWIHKSKLLRSVGLRATLNCDLDTRRFVLMLRLEKNGVVIFEEPILETKPDEVIFAYRFKDIVLEGRTLVVTNKFGDPAYRINIDSVK
ncbi:hypothetical protein HC928_17365 [bacterium]|nr:hypothetical protein [bacterium]